MDVQPTTRFLFESPVWDERDRTCVIGEIDGLLVCLMDFATTRAVILRTVLGLSGWPPVDRWCFTDRDLAVREAVGWIRGDADEPQGWVRHFPSGRYRENGDPARQEYVTRVAG